jgi:diguanylate cyclase (GGDEF)-like protein/PAS domain S-box-containing protein
MKGSQFPQAEVVDTTTQPRLIGNAQETLGQMGRSWIPKSPIVRHVLLSLAFTVIYLLLNQPGVIFISRLGSVAWYPANGLVLALLLGIDPWYAVLVCFCDAMAGHLIYRQPFLTFGETIGAAGVALTYGTAAYMLRGPLHIDFRMYRGRDVVRYVFVTMTAAVIATFWGVLCLIGDHSISWSDFWPSAANWFIGDGIGIVALAPFLLIHVIPWVRQWLNAEANPIASPHKHRTISTGFTQAYVLDTIGQAACVLFVLWIMFGPRWAHLELFYLSFVPILWMAMRSGIRIVIVGSLALNFGIVVSLHLFPPNPNLLAKIGLLMLVVSASGLIVGATVTERQLLGIELHERTTYLNSLFENSPLGIVVLNPKARVDLVNDAFSKLSLYESSELLGLDLDSIFLPSGSAETDTPWASEVLAGHPVHRIVQRRRKDGSLLDLELNAVPLVIGGYVQGAYAICKDISGQIKASRAEREHAESLNHLIKELELQTSQMTMLNEMGSLLECCATTKEACAVVGRSVQKVFPHATSGTLYTFKASRNLVETAVSWGNSSAMEPVFAPQSCWALRRGQPHWSESGGGGIVCPHLETLPSADHLCIPMVGQGETLGILHLEFARGKSEAGDLLHTQRLAVTVAGQVALSLASLRLRETLRDQSIRDSLTGLFNRRFMQESLEREIMRARRKNHPLSLLFLDIDHFKRFNDTFGHDAGDSVLQSVAELLHNFFRGDDVACRCGGEEFAVILPESLAQHAVIRADDFRAAVKSLQLRHKDTRLGPISVSIGVAAFPEHCATAEDLLKVADQCLYQSKSYGRDRVTVALPQQPADEKAKASHA